MYSNTSTCLAYREARPQIITIAVRDVTGIVLTLDNVVGI